MQKYQSQQVTSNYSLRSKRETLPDPRVGNTNMPNGAGSIPANQGDVVDSGEAPQGQVLAAAALYELKEGDNVPLPQKSERRHEPPVTAAQTQINDIFTGLQQAPGFSCRDARVNTYATIDPILLAKDILTIHPIPSTLQADEQFCVKLTLSPIPRGITKLHLARHTIALTKFLSKPPHEKSPDTLELSTALVCSSAMQKPECRSRAFARAASAPQSEDSCSNRTSGEDDKNKPLNGGEVKICTECIKRERTRAGRRKSKNTKEERAWSKDISRRVIFFNTQEVKEWRQPSQDTIEDSLELELPMRIACLCLHYEEEQGFEVIFTIKDCNDRLVAQAITSSIMITNAQHTSSAKLSAPCVSMSRIIERGERARVGDDETHAENEVLKLAGEYGAEEDLTPLPTYDPVRESAQPESLKGSAKMITENKDVSQAGHAEGGDLAQTVDSQSTDSSPPSSSAKLPKAAEGQEAVSCIDTEECGKGIRKATRIRDPKPGTPRQAAELHDVGWDGLQEEQIEHGHSERKETEDGNLLFSCTDCAKQYPSKIGLGRHRYSEHIPKEMLRCAYHGCESEFTKPQDLLGHVKSHIENSPQQKNFACYWDVCKRQLDLSEANDHLNAHALSPYSCDFNGCKKSFITLNRLRRHRNVHTGELNIPCPWPGCGMTLSTPDSFGPHWKSHTKQDLFYCEKCTKGFSSNRNLKVHMRFHEPKTVRCATGKRKSGSQVEMTDMPRKRRKANDEDPSRSTLVPGPETGYSLRSLNKSKTSAQNLISALSTTEDDGGWYAEQEESYSEFSCDTHGEESEDDRLGLESDTEVSGALTVEDESKKAADKLKGRERNVEPGQEAKAILTLHSLPKRQRRDIQFDVTLELSPLPPGITKLHFPAHTISRRKLLSDPDEKYEKSPDTLELYTNVVCSSAIQNLEYRSRAFDRAASAPRSQDSNETSEVTPLNGGDVKICKSCEKKNGKTESSAESSVIFFNCLEVEEWHLLERRVSSMATCHARARIVCDCIHQKERLGFQVIFTIKDYNGRLIAQEITSSIWITGNMRRKSCRVPAAWSWAIEPGVVGEGGEEVFGENIDKALPNIDPELRKRMVSGQVTRLKELTAVQVKHTDTTAAGAGLASLEPSTPERLPRIETPPPEAFPGTFECQLCFEVVSFNTLAEWILHIYRDLKPYTCLDKDCQNLRSRTTRGDWVKHDKLHRKDVNLENERCRICQWYGFTDLLALQTCEVTHIERYSLGVLQYLKKGVAVWCIYVRIPTSQAEQAAGINESCDTDTDQPAFDTGNISDCNVDIQVGDGISQLELDSKQYDEEETKCQQRNDDGPCRTEEASKEPIRLDVHVQGDVYANNRSSETSDINADTESERFCDDSSEQPKVDVQTGVVVWVKQPFNGGIIEVKQQLSSSNALLKEAYADIYTQGKLITTLEARLDDKKRKRQEEEDAYEKPFRELTQVERINSADILPSIGSDEETLIGNDELGMEETQQSSNRQRNPVTAAGKTKAIQYINARSQPPIDFSDGSLPDDIFSSSGASFTNQGIIRLSTHVKTNKEFCYDCLRPGEFVGDEVVYASLVELGFGLDCHIYPSHYPFPSTAKRRKVVRARFLVCPVNHPHRNKARRHWSVAVADTEAAIVYYRDSAWCPEHSNFAESLVVEFLRREHNIKGKTWVWKKDVVPQQDNGYDCAIHAIRNGFYGVIGIPTPQVLDSAAWRRFLTIIHGLDPVYSDRGKAITNDTTDVGRMQEDEQHLDTILLELQRGIEYRTNAIDALKKRISVTEKAYISEGYFQSNSNHDLGVVIINGFKQEIWKNRCVIDNLENLGKKLSTLRHFISWALLHQREDHCPSSSESQNSEHENLESTALIALPQEQINISPSMISIGTQTDEEDAVTMAVQVMRQGTYKLWMENYRKLLELQNRGLQKKEELEAKISELSKAQSAQEISLEVHSWLSETVQKELMQVKEKLRAETERELKSAKHQHEELIKELDDRPKDIVVLRNRLDYLADSLKACAEKFEAVITSITSPLPVNSWPW